MNQVKRNALLSSFSCLQDACPETCCKVWDMQVDEITQDLYDATGGPLSAITEAIHHPSYPTIMKKDEKTQYCTQLCDNICSIHRDYGEDFLGDACYFYPRITRKIGEEIYQSASLSCPEVVRLFLNQENAWKDTENTVVRLPFVLHNYGYASLKASDVQKIMEDFHEYIEEHPDDSIETIFLCFLRVCTSLDRMEKEDWGRALPTYLKMAHNLIPHAQKDPGDHHRIIHIFGILKDALAKPSSVGLNKIFADIEEKSSEEKFLVSAKMTPSLEKILKQWVQGQLASNHFPFAGLGETCFEKMLIITMRYVTLRSTLLCYYDKIKSDDAKNADSFVIYIIYTLSRFFDHLADPSLSLALYKKAGWDSLERIRGLLEG